VDAVRALSVFAGADIAFDQQVHPFGERRGEFRELTPGNAAMPIGFADVSAGLAVFPGPLGGSDRIVYGV
jgi:hypothetical protein